MTTNGTAFRASSDDSSNGELTQDAVAIVPRSWASWSILVALALLAVATAVAAASLDDSGARRVWCRAAQVGVEIGDARGCVLILPVSPNKAVPPSACKTSRTQNPDGSWTITRSLRVGPIPMEALIELFAAFASENWWPTRVPDGAHATWFIPKQTIASSASIGVLPLIIGCFGPWRRSRRRRNKQCVNCGYFLFGLHAPRCPECGFDNEKLAGGEEEAEQRFQRVFYK
jgi:hypothetical protein